jgi:imidazolonepropionase-like amidohydrolase
LLDLLALLSLSAFGAELLPPGNRPVPPGVHALVGGTVVVRPGEVIDQATVVIRDGFIQAVGKDVTAPGDARLWDLTGATIYAGFIDPYLAFASTNPPVNTAKTEADSGARAGGMNFFGVPRSERGRAQGPGSDVGQVLSQSRIASSFAPEKKALEAVRELGFAAGNVVPEKGILRGTSALVALSGVAPNDAIIKADTFQHVAFDAESGPEDVYPRSLMGAIAVVRQAFFDAQHYALEHDYFRRQPQGRKRPEFNPSLEALAPATEKQMRAAFEPGSALMADRAARVARELDLNFCELSSGQEWRRPDLVKAAGVPFIVPLDFPELPKMPEDQDWEQISLDQFRAWDWAPENAALLREQGLEIALTTHGLSDKKNFRRNLRFALDRGLSEADALAALTTIPARLCGVADQLGTIEAGKIANLTVVQGNYFDPENRVREVWIDGRVYPVRPGEAKSAAKNDGAPAGTGPDPTPKETKPAGDKKKNAVELRDIRKKRVARSPLDGRGPLAGPPQILVEGATIWTCGPQGKLENADLLVEGGKIKAVGQRLRSGTDISGSALVIDGRGKHVTPGIIDAHNHSMALGAVNEGTLPSSAMVRIGDVVNSESVNIHKQLAGGLTTLNLLHGSANPIGGQNAILKLRDGASPEELKFAGAPPGIKFALGENVKQSNWGERRTNRFPQTRMGVRTFFANRFTAAQEYLKEWEDYSNAVAQASSLRTNQAVSGPPAPLPPRRDLELEALGEILQGKRWIHCHSYRQDEVLAFLRAMESFGVRVGTLQHILEGYKVADEIAKHGAGASTFADWWAYKFEVYDAIPYNGSLMRERGVVVSFNSDSSDLSRRLYLEAAKAVKYGGTPEAEALKFVTQNPARQLGLDASVGSLEPGKDADFVIWSKAPLDSTTVCLQTWIEGKKYFDRDLEAARSEALEKERTALLEKAKKLQAGGGSAEGGEKEKDKFFELPLEHRFDNADRHCLEEE